MHRSRTLGNDWKEILLARRREELRRQSLAQREALARQEALVRQQDVQQVELKTAIDVDIGVERAQSRSEDVGVTVAVDSATDHSNPSIVVTSRSVSPKTSFIFSLS